DDVEVGPGSDPFALQHRFAGTRCCDHDIEPARGVVRLRDRDDVDAALAAHLRGKRLAALLVWAENIDVPDRPHLADGEELRAGLLAGAEEAHSRGIGPGEVPRRDAAGRAGADLAKVIGLHPRQVLAGLAVEQMHVKLRAAAIRYVSLQAHHTER